MTYVFCPRGVCSHEMRVEVDERHIILHMEVKGGCSGNLQGISSLVCGMRAEDAIARLKGIRCGFKDTSCPDQFARHLEKALQQS
ncbi:MAG: TIGR03905 family TSCPD domain-containing protein [Oscillibacter sp.]